MFSEDEARSFWEGIQEEVLERDRPEDDPLSDREYSARSDRHRDSRALYELVTDDRLTDKLVSLYGEDLLLWFTNVWDKPGNSPAIDWHQELNAISIYPPVCALSWVAMSHATKESGCLEIIPGSHFDHVPHEPVPEDERFVLTERADTDAFDESKAVSLEAEPGEAIFFNAFTLHRSRANQSDETRAAVNMAVMPPHVQLNRSIDRFFPEHQPMIASGENSAPLHDTIEPPSE